jgi:hypothetical protein
MVAIDLSTVAVDELIPVLTNFKHSNQSILPFTLSGSSEDVFVKLLEKSATMAPGGRVEVSRELLHHIVDLLIKSLLLTLYRQNSLLCRLALSLISRPSPQPMLSLATSPRGSARLLPILFPKSSPTLMRCLQSFLVALNKIPTCY